jgi:hypothetical protein
VVKLAYTRRSERRASADSGLRLNKAVTAFREDTIKAVKIVDAADHITSLADLEFGSAVSEFPYS